MQGVGGLGVSGQSYGFGEDDEERENDGCCGPSWERPEIGGSLHGWLWSPCEDFLLGLAGFLAASLGRSSSLAEKGITWW